MDVFPGLLGNWYSGFRKNRSVRSGLSDHLIWFALKRQQRQEHWARTGITVKCRPHGTWFFPPSVCIIIMLPPPHPTLTLLQYLQLALVPVCRKCYSNSFQSTTADWSVLRIGHHDDLDEVGGGGHTDWECGHTCVLCVCVCVCTQLVRQPNAQSDRQRTLVVCCSRQEADSSVFIRISLQYVKIRIQQIWGLKADTNVCGINLLIVDTVLIRSIHMDTLNNNKSQIYETQTSVARFSPLTPTAPPSHTSCSGTYLTELAFVYRGIYK